MSRQKKGIGFNISSSGCYECVSHCVNSDGYPVFGNNGKTVRISRHIYEECFGPIEEGKVIRHKCDNRLCINPEHLEVGTRYENNMDRDMRDRTAKGQTITCAKLTEEQVVQILNTDHLSYMGLAIKYGVSKGTIQRIKERKTWKHV